MILNKVEDIRSYFKQELSAKRFTTDKTGQKTIELIGASFVADEPSIFGKPSKQYIDAELEWYLSRSTNINDIYKDKEPPQAWQYAANEHGEINSNYGKLIFDELYYKQYNKVLNELRENRDSRRACMVYTRPSIWYEYNENGKSDFICTNAVTYYIRENKIHAVVQMRSNDVVFGYKNDYAWQKFVLDMLIHDINTNRPRRFPESAKYVDGLEAGNIYWQVQNLHVYERHFELVS
jgi:thymidylate synthase